MVFLTVNSLPIVGLLVDGLGDYPSEDFGPVLTNFS